MCLGGRGGGRGYPRREKAQEEIIQGANDLGENCPGGILTRGELVGGNCLGDNCQGGGVRGRINLIRLHLLTQNAGQQNGTVVDGFIFFALLKRQV